MKKVFQTAKKVLKKYDYLHLYALSQLIKNEDWFPKDTVNHEDLLNSIILEDIKINKTNSTFIKVWLETYALRRKTVEENLYSFIKYRLSELAFWDISARDVDYSMQIFGTNLFDEEKNITKLLDDLKKTKKIKNYTTIANKQFIIGF